MAREFYIDNEAAMDWLSGAKIMLNDSNINADYYGVIKFGYSELVTNTYYSIWPVAALYPWDTIRNGVAMEIVSASSDDTFGGSGAQTVTIIGLDSVGNRKFATVQMNGTNAVSLPDTWSFIGRAFVALGNAAGTITVRTQSGSTTVAFIATNENQTQQAVWRVPKGFTGIVRIRKVFATNTTSKAGEIEMYARYDTTTTGFRELVTIPFDGTALAFTGFPGLPWVFPENTEIDFRAIRASGTGTVSVYVDFEIINVRNELIQ